ncbi:hypothetical protein ACPCHT_00025 [Nucisporomicrobium flavum]|uniref:hypothetical protein n=1 Tax=Nucisporomicrobium flavum TaxID=2785915 RepID=UPI003C2EA148
MTQRIRDYYRQVLNLPEPGEAIPALLCKERDGPAPLDPARTSGSGSLDDRQSREAR